MRELWTPRLVVNPLPDGAILELIRGRKVEDVLRLGPNMVHAAITHPDGSLDDLGISLNLITDGGKDHVARILGGKLGFGGASAAATATGATSLTDSGQAWTTNAYVGMQVVAEQGTSSPVWANIVSNTGTVLTVDAWRNGDDTAGTTPGSTANYQILPGGPAARYMAITENAGAASASDTALTGELTTGGCGRALATYAHTNGTNTYTLQKAFSVTASFPAIHKMGLFPHITASTGPLIFETVLNADANVLSGDTLTITETVTLS